MNYTIKVKRLGQNWYLDVNHLDPADIMFNRKICKVFNIYDLHNSGELFLILRETHNLTYSNTLFINDEDLLRYFTTDESFNMRFIIQDHEFSISTEMYTLIENEFNPNFHNNYYNLEILN